MNASSAPGPRPDLVIFDFDGCLVDSEAMALEILAELLAELGAPEDVGALRRFLGVSLHVVLEHVARATGRPCPPDFAAEWHRRLFAAYERELRVMAGAAEFLDRLDALGLPCCIASGAATPRLEAALRLSGLAGRFAGRAYSADLVAHGKPAPDLFLLAAARQGTRPERCVVVEDATSGVKGAVAAGMRVLGFVGGSHLEGVREAHALRLREAGAAAVYADYERLAHDLLGDEVAGGPAGAGS
ncbi:HAD family hydrolase [Rubellimicrobium arenae]|uniref:HAD family hydrolase n=1 Tax=Rubellimicrobium arenae TaxID=2817372 RepID=UPI001B30569F|nr:HAD-IA family hydrolase [Rubellimicrobium arenae]